MKGEDAADLSASRIVRRSRIASRNSPYAKTSSGVKNQDAMGWTVRRGARSGFTLSGARILTPSFSGCGQLGARAGVGPSIATPKGEGPVSEGERLRRPRRNGGSSPNPKFVGWPAENLNALCSRPRFLSPLSLLRQGRPWATSPIVSARSNINNSSNGSIALAWWRKQ